MGIFNYGYILEVEVPDDDGAEQYAMDDNEPEEDTPEEITEPEEEPDPQQDEEPEEDNDEEDDYTLEGDDEEEDPEDDTMDNEEDSMGGDDYSSEDDSNSLDGQIKQSEDELMEDLSAQEKYVRDKELKKIYVDLYNSISNILMKVDRVVKTADNIKILNYCEKRLESTQEMLYDYLLDSYGHKSYIQNLTMYYEIIGILTGIEQLFTSLTSSTKV